jgi:hypothetical protein
MKVDELLLLGARLSMSWWKRWKIGGWGEYGINPPYSSIMPILNGRGWRQLPEGLKTPLRDDDGVILSPRGT